jgi:hypothetical protein
MVSKNMRNKIFSMGEILWAVADAKPLRRITHVELKLVIHPISSATERSVLILTWFEDTRVGLGVMNNVFPTTNQQ